mmetsp:Transcript_21570/g.66925  ORF Transcript_21570/g.66925 Transcript_21570/m.66925 type:complete len:330 (-) Transcript_21570:668-1657(-)
MRMWIDGCMLRPNPPGSHGPRRRQESRACRDLELRPCDGVQAAAGERRQERPVPRRTSAVVSRQIRRRGRRHRRHRRWHTAEHRKRWWRHRRESGPPRRRRRQLRRRHRPRRGLRGRHGGRGGQSRRVDSRRAAADVLGVRIAVVAGLRARGRGRRRRAGRSRPRRLLRPLRPLLPHPPLPQRLRLLHLRQQRHHALRERPLPVARRHARARRLDRPERHDGHRQRPGRLHPRPRRQVRLRVHLLPQHLAEPAEELRQRRRRPPDGCRHVAHVHDARLRRQVLAAVLRHAHLQRALVAVDGGAVERGASGVGVGRTLEEDEAEAAARPG